MTKSQQTPARRPSKKPNVTTPVSEHSVPLLWPIAAAVEMEEEGLKLFQENLKFVAEAEEISAPPPLEWASKNRVTLDMDTMRLRDFSPEGATATTTPVLIDTPYAGHHSSIADYAKGQSLVETLLASGLERIHVTDWKSATSAMKDFDIDKYLAEINVVVDDLGGRVHLVGLCQGGWMSAMYSARFPDKVRSLVLAGAPIDAGAGNGPIKKMAHRLPMKFYEDLVASGGGRMLGRYMLAGWKNMHPEKQYLGKYLDLYAHIEDRCYIKRTERFERWYENPIDLPGRYYLEAVGELFKRNLFAKGEFVGLGRKLKLKDVTAPIYLLAGESDDITTKEQVFNTEALVGTPTAKIKKTLAPGGHISLFMGSRTLGNLWPDIGRWIKRQDGGARRGQTRRREK
jgi:poly(3-hydroxybutyrate) depolymerase